MRRCPGHAWLEEPVSSNDLAGLGLVREQVSADVAAGEYGSVSGHCAPNLHAHVAAATPGLRHLEWFHNHVRSESLAFEGALDPAGGIVTPDRSAPGHGLTFRADAMERYRDRS